MVTRLLLVFAVVDISSGKVYRRLTTGQWHRRSTLATDRAPSRKSLRHLPLGLTGPTSNCPIPQTLPRCATGTFLCASSTGFSTGLRTLSAKGMALCATPHRRVALTTRSLASRSAHGAVMAIQEDFPWREGTSSVQNPVSMLGRKRGFAQLSPRIRSVGSRRPLAGRFLLPMPWVEIRSCRAGLQKRPRTDQP